MIAEGFPSPPPSQYQPRFFCKSGLASRWTVYARVWNIGPLAAPGVALRVYAAWSDYNIWSGDGSTNFSKFQLIGGTYLNLGNKMQRANQARYFRNGSLAGVQAGL
jgi:hypothetical protein